MALAVAETVLRELGATPEQIDRERDRVQSELFEKVVPEEGGDQSDAESATATGEIGPGTPGTVAIEDANAPMQEVAPRNATPDA